MGCRPSQRTRLWAALCVVTLWGSGWQACTPQRYAATNKLHNQRLKALTADIARPLPYATPPLVATFDSAGTATAVEAPRKNAKPEWVGAIHFNLRKPNFVILHHTAQDSLEQTLRTFTVPHVEASAHYVIGRDGEVYQMLNDYVRGWHAGAGKWGSVTDLNSVSLGIELDNNGKEPFAEPQLHSLLKLLDTLKRNYNIPTANFIAHADIAPTRKVDPSALFPWKRLAERGFGLWPKEEQLVDPPERFNPLDALRIIGYDTRNAEAAIRAFKLHYIQTEVNAELSARDLQVLYALYLMH